MNEQKCKSDEIIKFKCTKLEKNFAQKECADKGITLRELLLRPIIIDTESAGGFIYEKRKILQATCNISNEVEKLKMKYIQIDTTGLQKEVEKLCQYL